MNKNKYFPTCISNGKAKSIPKYVWNSCCCQKINPQSGWGIGLYCGSITQILVSVTAVRNPLPAEEKKTNYTLFLQRYNIFPQKNNYLNIPAGNLNSLSNLRFLQYVSKDKMKFHNPTPEKNQNVFPQKMKYTRSDGRQNFIQKMDTISSLWFQISFHLNNSCINKCSYSKVFFESLVNRSNLESA